MSLALLDQACAQMSDAERRMSQYGYIVAENPAMPEPLAAITRELYERTERAAWSCVQHWAHYGFEVLGPLLRSGKLARSTHKRWTPEKALERIEGLDALMQPLPEPITVHRGCELRPFMSRDSWREPSYCSTSLDDAVAERFAHVEGGLNPKTTPGLEKWQRSQPVLMTIHLAAGHPMLALGATPASHMDEREILLARGTQMNVTRRRMRAGILHLEMTATHTGRMLSPMSSWARRRTVR